MKRRILLVDDDVAILLTLKAVLEISGFEVTTAASAREAKQKLKSNEYHMVITDLRMESETAGEEVAAAAKKAANRPAVAWEAVDVAARSFLGMPTYDWKPTNTLVTAANVGKIKDLTDPEYLPDLEGQFRSLWKVDK